MQLKKPTHTLVLGIICVTFSLLYATCGQKEPTKSNTQPSFKKAYQQIAASQKYIRSGDLITRRGNDITSYSLKQFSQQNNTYSHCGIASIENDTVFVYHAIGGECNPNQKLKRETFAQFCNPAENEAFGIFRLPINNTIWNRLHNTILTYYKAEIKFDMKFDLSTDDRMYCAEFVSKAYSKAFQQPHMFSTYHIKNWEYIAVDNIFLYKKCTPIANAFFNACDSI